QDFELMVAFHRGPNMRKTGKRLNQVGGNITAIRGLERGRGEKANRQRGTQHPHDAVTPPKPCWVADGGGLPPRRSTSLYHVINAATVTIKAMPARLTMTCIAMRPEISVRMKWAEKDRNTPRQKISSECSPHRISGRAHRVRRNFASAGT